MDMKKTGNRLKGYYARLGLLSRVTILELDTVTSAPSHDMYKERQKSQKVYKSYEVDALVDEVVIRSYLQRNLMQATGSKDNYDVVVYIFGDSPVEPQVTMKVRYNGQEVDVVTVNRFHNNMNSGEMGWALNCKRVV